MKHAVTQRLRRLGAHNLLDEASRTTDMKESALEISELCVERKDVWRGRNYMYWEQTTRGHVAFQQYLISKYQLLYFPYYLDLRRLYFV